MSKNKTMKLIISLTSPYARKARITAIEKNIPVEVSVDVPWNEDTGVIKLNPLGKVPVLVTETGEAIYDSRVIVEYLDTFPGPSLIPQKVMEKIKVKHLEALADGIMDASLALFAERRKRPSELQHQWWIDRQFGKVHRGLKHLDEIIDKKKFFYGDTMTLADIAVASALGYVGLRFSEDFPWQELYPNLAHFYISMLERPSFKDTVPVA
ncbi:MAG: glutathione S-transferase N-terminal domain-containing protein [Pseudobdellovibrionaceae bacterium]